MTACDISNGIRIETVEIPINVRDARAARTWYADTLGIVFDDRGRAEVAGVTLVLFEFADVTPCSHVVAQFVTSDLVQTRQRLADRVSDVPAIDEANWNLVISDPTGNKLVFYEPRP